MTLNGAIMQLVEMRENSMMPVVFKPYFDKVIETISECVEPSEIPQWIPCSERLPEERGYYLTTTKNGEVYCDYWNEDNFDRTELVITWMPLPEPYKGQEMEK